MPKFAKWAPTECYILKAHFGTKQIGYYESSRTPNGESIKRLRMQLGLVRGCQRSRAQFKWFEHNFLVGANRINCFFPSGNKDKRWKMLIFNQIICWSGKNIKYLNQLAENLCRHIRMSISIYDLLHWEWPRRLCLYTCPFHPLPVIIRNKSSCDCLQNEGTKSKSINEFNPKW